MYKIEDFKAFTKHRELGVFDKLYVIDQTLSDGQEEQLGEWLSLNCTKNFIMTKNTTQIYAGGSSDNAEGWASRHIPGYHDERREYMVKLYKQDILLFEMVWLTT